MPLENIMLPNLRPRPGSHFDEVTPDSILRAADICAQRIDEESLRDTSFLCSDVALYVIERYGPILYLGGPACFRNFLDKPKVLNTRKSKDFRGCLKFEGNSSQIADIIIASCLGGNGLKVAIDDLNLQGEGEIGFFEVNTTNYSDLKLAQLSLVERVYGHARSPSENKNLGLLKDAGIESTKIYVLNSQYIRDSVCPGKNLARLAVLNSFSEGASFSAVKRYAEGLAFPVRGRYCPIPDSSRNVDPTVIKRACAVIAQNPSKLNGDTAAQLLAAVSQYYNSAKK